MAICSITRGQTCRLNRSTPHFSRANTAAVLGPLTAVKLTRRGSGASEARIGTEKWVWYLKMLGASPKNDGYPLVN